MVQSWSSEESLDSVMRDVAMLEHELGLRASFTSAHRADPEYSAFQWNSVCSGAILECLGRVELEASSLCREGTRYSTGCSGYETVGISVHCLKAGFRKANIGIDMCALAACAPV